MIDYKKIPAYEATTKPGIIKVPPTLFVKVDGEDAPGSERFKAAIKVVYGIFYAIKMWDKKHTPPKDYEQFTVAPLEAMWWTCVSEKFDPKSPEEWQWIIMIRVPNFVTQKFFEEVVEELVLSKKNDIYKKARLELTHEGFCVQILHIGPYDKEDASLKILRDYANKNKYEIYGRHHEIYLNYPGRTAPDKLKTVLRYAVRQKTAEIVIEA